MHTPSPIRTRATRLAVAGLTLLGVVAFPSVVAAAPNGPGSPSGAKPTIVLEHGAWADGSSWDAVVTRLQKDGYTVDVPPNPLRGVTADSAYLASYLATVPGPIVLVGHSYGGFVTTDAATGNANVKALVYVDAYIPAQGETLDGLTTQFPGSQIAPTALSFVPSAGGVVDAYVKPAQFGAILANDLPANRVDRRRGARRAVRSPGVGDDPQLGGHRHRRPRHPAGRARVHGPARARRRHDDRRLAPVADLPARNRHPRHRAGRRPHLLTRAVAATGAPSRPGSGGSAAPGGPASVRRPVLDEGRRATRPNVSSSSGATTGRRQSFAHTDRLPCQRAQSVSVHRRGRRAPSALHGLLHRAGR